MDDYMFRNAGGRNYGVNIWSSNSRSADDVFFVYLLGADGKTKVVLLG